MKSNLTKLSIHLSYILRHKPESIGLSLDSEGWADIDELIRKNESHKHSITREELLKIVETDEKSRYKLSHDCKKIRASQGHSSKLVGLVYELNPPPVVLYHGTPHLPKIF